MFHFLFNICVCHSLFVTGAAISDFFLFFVLLSEGWLVLLQSEISHLSVTSLTGQAAIGGCAMQLLLGGFSSFFFCSVNIQKGSFEKINLFILVFHQFN